MKFFYAVSCWICLSGFGSSATDGISIKGHKGGQVTVKCIYSWASDNRKYFCRDPCKYSDVLVSSDRSRRGRFSLKDFGNGMFTVTITDLQKSDSGIYYCGVERAGLDTYEEVNLRVSKAVAIHTTRRTPTTVTKSDSQTSTSRSFTSAPDDITDSFTGLFIPPTTEKQTFLEKAGLLVCIAAGLTVMLLLFGAILSIYKKKKRNSQSSGGSPAGVAKRPTTKSTRVRSREMEGDYEDIMEIQKRTDPLTPTVYSAVNHHSAANQIEDSSLYCNLSIHPSYHDQTAKSNTDTVMYTTIDLRKKQGLQIFRSEDTVTYDTVFCS